MNQLITMPQRSKGYALVTAMIFLILMTLVALAAIRGSGLEAKMSSNSTSRTQAFEASELSRTLIDNLVDANTSYRGWPATAGGTLAAGVFDASALALIANSSTGFGISKDSSNKARNWFSNSGVCQASTTSGATVAAVCPSFAPNILGGSAAQDATYLNTITGNSGSTSTGAIPVAAELAVYKLRVSYGTGASIRMAAGYEGFGQSAASGGGNLYFYVSSSGHESSNKDATAQTAAVFREIIRN